MGKTQPKEKQNVSRNLGEKHQTGKEKTGGEKKTGGRKLEGRRLSKKHTNIGKPTTGFLKKKQKKGSHATSRRKTKVGDQSKR